MGCSTLLLASLVSTLGGMVFGYELGIISGALLQLKTEFGLSCVQQEALVSSLLIGSLLASIVGGSLIDHHGRKSSILFSNVLVLIGSLLLLISSYPALVLGRITVGFAICLSSMSCCIFVSEMVNPDRRGILVTLYEAGITVGILVAYAMNYILSSCKGGWKWMFALAAVPTLVQLVSFWFLPSSTQESLKQNDCFQTGGGLMSTAETHRSDDLKVCHSKERRELTHSFLYLFQRQDNMRTRTAIGLGLVLFQQFTGQPNILFYASTVFHSVGFESDDSAVLASVGLGLVKVIATLTTMVFSDSVGRRPLLISGCSIMALCLVAIGLMSRHSLVTAVKPCDAQNFSRTHLPHSYVHEPCFEQRHPLFENNTQVDDALSDIYLNPTPESSQSVSGTVVNWIIVMCLMGVVSAYSFGFGPMTWLLLTEIFPAAVRGRAFAFANCFNTAANLLVTFTFLNVLDVMGLSGMFLVYGLTAATAALFFYIMLPETKGKSLEDIDNELRLNRFLHSDECCSFNRCRNTSPQYQRVHCHVSTSV
ncbi:solute carrier family 2, facilitated glucose transporter member 10 isoform 1-T2 [Pholidichthys leucotaenia]